MTKRERVVCALEHRTPDRIPASDSFWDTTLLRWKEEGFPEEISPYEFFDFDIQMIYLDVSPRFPAVLIGEDEQMFTFRDRFGYVARRYRDGSPTLDYVSHPAPDRESWEGMRSHASGCHKNGFQSVPTPIRGQSHFSSQFMDGLHTDRSS